MLQVLQVLQGRECAWVPASSLIGRWLLWSYLLWQDLSFMGLAISTEILTRLFRRSRPGHSSHSDLSHLPLTSEGVKVWVYGYSRLVYGYYRSVCLAACSRPCSSCLPLPP